MVVEAVEGGWEVGGAVRGEGRLAAAAVGVVVEGVTVVGGAEVCGMCRTPVVVTLVWTLSCVRPVRS